MAKKGYLICSYARTGSSLLCNALIATGQLGVPNEYLSTNGNDSAVPKDPKMQIANILSTGTTANGIYGAKVFCHHFDSAGGINWIRHLPNPHFVHLERQDALGQAISFAKASQTRQWNSNMVKRGTPQYDEGLILHLLATIAHDRARWLMFFARNGLTPLQLTFDQVVSSLPETVKLVADLLDVDILESELVDLVKVAPQSDSVNLEWRDRFLHSQRDLSFLDEPWAHTSSRKLLKAVVNHAKNRIVKKLRPY
jgi:trehalose 2-sulfotransferase